MTRADRFPMWTLGVATGINVVLFGLAALLLQERRAPQDMTDPIGVSLVQLEAPSPPEEQEIKKVEKPEPAQKMDFMPDIIRPQLSGPGPMDLGVAMSLGAAEGISGTREFVFEAYELDQAPTPIVRVPPAYPYGARERGIEGAVQVRMLVTTEGTVGDVEILEARPKGVFEDAVRRTVPQWRFSPGKIEGKAVTAWVITTIHFNLSTG
ncbi:MAG: energy transducer TonB [Candidatus Eisenbacteria bacterium]|nr:energy transducer TonB [Candidatus Eisenbacteria bacterium]